MVGRFERGPESWPELLGMLIGLVICEPKLRLGRRRHDGTCDHCGEPHGTYYGERLDFPLDDYDPDASTSREKLRAMLDAEYERVCLECSVEIEAGEGGDR